MTKKQDAAGKFRAFEGKPPETKSDQTTGISGSAKNDSSSHGTTAPGIELEEDQARGKDSGWSPQGGQPHHSEAEAAGLNSTENKQDSTHFGKTQSTTNSQ